MALTLSSNMSNMSNLSSNDTCEIQDGVLSLYLPLAYALICLMGFLSNTISIMIFFLHRNEDSSKVVYMRHLMLANLLLVLCLPLRIMYHYKEGPYFLCKLVGVFLYINMYASIAFLSLISLDRYLKIIKPAGVFRVQKVLWSRTACYIIWSCLFLVNGLFFASNDHSTPCSKICFHFHQKGLLPGSINLAMVVLFGVLCLVLSVSYVKIALKLATVEMGDPKRKKHLILTFLVPVIFTLCFLPYHLVRVPYILAQMDVIGEVASKQMLHIWNENTLLLSTLNSCLNPIIYYFLSSVFRNTFLCAIQGKYNAMYDLRRGRLNFNQFIMEI